ncbi:MAG: DUF1819 family protein [Trueperaceae bacterium]|nr:DUF1819 family protein [Trueperaceae bacterium]
MRHLTIQTTYAAFTNQGFLLNEVSLGADLVLTGSSLSALRTQIVEDNLYQLSSKASRQTIATAVIDRLEPLDDTYLAFLAEGSLELRKLSNLVLILLRHRLLREFIAEVINEQLLRFSYELKKADINAFFERKQIQVPELAEWTEQTIGKSRRNILTICSDAGLIEASIKGNYRIRPQYVPRALRDALDELGLEALLPLLLDQGAVRA